jgi:hypothetical protein
MGHAEVGGAGVQLDPLEVVQQPIRASSWPLWMKGRDAVHIGILPERAQEIAHVGFIAARAGAQGMCVDANVQSPPFRTTAC